MSYLYDMRSGELVKSRLYTNSLLLKDSLGFNPLTLFTGGKQGVWYDPSDITTLFKDAAGTRPVTADGDPVGLMLDKSQGLELGSELVQNGGFDNDVSGWSSSKSGATFSWDSGKGRLDFTDIGDVGIIQTINQPAGFCEVTVTLTRQFIGATALRVWLASTSTGDVVVNEGETKTIRFISYRATEGKADLLVRTARGTATGYFTVDNVSIKNIKGNHATQTVSASRPIYRTDGVLHWLSFDGVDDAMAVSISMLQPLFIALAHNTTPFDSSKYPKVVTSTSGGIDIYTNKEATRINAGTVVIGRVFNFDKNSFSVVSIASTYASVYLEGSRTSDSTPAKLVGDRGLLSPTLFAANKINVYSVIFADGELVADNADDINSHLAQKSGVTL